MSNDLDNVSVDQKIHSMYDKVSEKGHFYCSTLKKKRLRGTDETTKKCFKHKICQHSTGSIPWKLHKLATKFIFMTFPNETNKLWNIQLK